MPTFNFNTFTTSAQTLLNNESGFVGAAGAVSTVADVAVLGTGAYVLTVLGTVSSMQNDAVVGGASTTSMRLTVGENGSITSAFDDAMNILASQSATIQNAGLIGSLGSALVFSAEDSGANLTLSNTGTITAGVEATVSAFVGLGVARITNAGNIVNAGGVAALSLTANSTGGSIIIVNTGNIQASAAAAISTNGPASLNNSGTIIGNVFLSGNTGNTVRNKGLVDGSLITGGGSDQINLIGGQVTGDVDGGEGDDTYTIDDSTVLIVDAGGVSDRIFSWASYTAGAGIEQLRLLGEADLRGRIVDPGLLNGNGGDNRLIGSLGSDTVGGGAGNDTLIGGGGDDVYFASANDRIVEAETGGIDTVNVEVGDSGSDRYVLTANVENLIAQDQFKALTGNAGANIIDASNTTVGVTINGAGGADTMTGGTGDDTFITDGGDSISGGGGTDTVRSSVNYTIGAEISNLVLTGSAVNGTGNLLNNRIDGNAAANRLNGGGGAGTDTMAGGAGNDTYIADIGDTIIEGAGGGIDTVRASDSFTLANNIENLVLTGTLGTVAIGNGLANAITGNAIGNGLDGKGGSDTLTGGAGDDLFIFSTTLGAGNIDRVTNFRAVDDSIWLDDAVFAGLASGALASGAFQRNASGLATQADDRIIFETDTGRLFFDSDGVGGAAGVQFATLNAGIVLTAGDFEVF